MKSRDLRIFFCERLEELFNWNVIDSYRVRCHNELSLLRELSDVMKNWLAGNVKTIDTVCWCIEETCAVLKRNDGVDFSYFDKELFLKELDAYRKAQKHPNEKTEYIVHLVDSCIAYNESKYLAGLYKGIDGIVLSEYDVDDEHFKPVVDRLEALTSSLACELLCEGFSHRHLYSSVREMLSNIQKFDEAYETFKQKHKHDRKEHDYTVVFKVFGENSKQLLTLDGFSDDVEKSLLPDECYKSVSQFIVNRGNCIFFKCQVKAKDTVAAMNRAKEKYDFVLDKAMLGYSKMNVTLQKHAMIASSYGEERVAVTKPISTLDSNYANDSAVASLIVDNIDALLLNDRISDDVKERLRSSIRHLRMGNTETDPGQKLVNYWIALEFLFSSPKASEGTIARLESNLTNVLMCGYTRRRMEYINEQLRACGIIGSEQSWWDLEPTELSKLITSIASQKLRYQLQCLKSCLYNKPEDARRFWEEHESNVRWHIYRIYRYRNRLVHEAAILPGIDNVTRNLRYYLVYFLNQLIGYMISEKYDDMSIDVFFYQYEQRYSLIKHKLSSNKNGIKDIHQLFLEVVVYKEFMRSLD